MKRFDIISLIVLTLSFSCTPIDKPEGDFPKEEGNAAENYTPEIPTDEDGYNGDSADDGDADNVVADDETYWENTKISNKVEIVYSDNYATVTSSNQSVKSYITNADVALDLNGLGGTEVVLQGTSNAGQIKIYSDSLVKLTLNGVKLTSDKSAAINYQGSSTLYVHLNDGTENEVCDAASQSDESYYPEGVIAKNEKRNGAVYSKGEVIFSGKGVLQITGKKKHGISVKAPISFRPGVTVVINDVADNGIKAEGITVQGGYLWIKTSADAGKCLSSDANISIEGGELKLYTSGNAIYDADEKDTSSAAGMKADGNLTIANANILCVSSGEGGKGINVDGNLTVESGTIEVATSGGKYVYNAAQDLDSSPKGIRVEGDIVINGGFINIQVTGKSEGSEGLESKSKLTVNGGEIFVYAYDDAINVGGDKPVGIEVNGGKIFAFADNNDGIDSNAMMWINGGLVIASGSAAPEEGLDCDRSQNFIVTGGTLIGTGGAAVSTSTSSTQRNVIYNGVNAKTGDLFVITDAEGNPILMYEMPRTMSKMAVFFSSPDIKAGETYTVYTGGSLSGNTLNWNGWFKDGKYTVGSQLGTFTSNSINTTVGQSGGPGGGGPGNGGGGNGGFGPGWWG